MPLALQADPPPPHTHLLLALLQPVISMAEGVWYRWRMLYSGAKGWSTFRFLDTQMQNSQQCEWLLIAKDGERARRPAPHGQMVRCKLVWHVHTHTAQSYQLPYSIQLHCAPLGLLQASCAAST
jgi:hypothetical protein